MMDGLMSDSALLKLFLFPTAWLIIGLTSSVLLARHQAKAHAALVVALVGMILTPFAQLTVAYFGYGLLQGPQAIAPSNPTTTDARAVATDPGLTVLPAMETQISELPVAVQDVIAESTASTFSAETAPSKAVAWRPRLNRTQLLWSAWALVSALFAVRTMLATIKARRLVKCRIPVNDPGLVQCLQSAATSLEIGDRPELGAADVHSPIVWCWGARPIVLVPFEAGMDGRDWVGIFRHELAHWKRKDHVTGLLAHAVAALLPWNPLVWIARRRLHVLSEQVCDQWAVVDGRSPLDYAESLLNLVPEARQTMALAAVTNRSLLKTRVTSLLHLTRVHPRVGKRWHLAFVVCGVVATVAIALAQASPTKRLDAAEKLANLQTDNPQMTISGSVKLENGNPAKGAQVAVLTRYKRLVRGGDFAADDPEVIQTATTDQNGLFEMKVPREASSDAFFTTVLARAAGHAIGWQALELNNLHPKAEITLAKDAPVRGRLIDINGQPAAGVTLYVRSIGKMVGGRLQGVILGEKVQAKPSFWPASVKTDDQGSFEVTGTSSELDVFMRTDDPRFAHSAIRISRGNDQNANSSNGVDNRVFSVAPSQIVEGVVISAETGQPIPNARIALFASPTNAGGGSGMAGVADAQGRFEMNPWAAPFYDIKAFAPDGQPYLTIRKIFEWPKGATRHKVEIALPTGVLVRGKLTEANSGAPIAGAGVEYAPRSKNPNLPEGLVTGWQNVSVSGTDGAFQIPVVAGEGSLLVKGPNCDYVPQEVGNRVIDDGLTGGFRMYPDAVIPLNLPAGTKSHDVEAKLRKGVKVSAQLVGPEGQAVEKALAIYTSYLILGEFQWRMPQEIGGKFELHGCDPDGEQEVMFLDAEHQWGAKVMIPGRTGQTEPLTIRLQPCATATARLLKKKGSPWTDRRIVPDLVVKPGPDRYDRKAYGEGKLMSTSAIYANIDRLHYWEGPKADKEGNVTYPALIPGATYRINSGKRGEFKEWIAKSGENFDLSEMRYDDD